MIVNINKNDFFKMVSTIPVAGKNISIKHEGLRGSNKHRLRGEAATFGARFCQDFGQVANVMVTLPLCLILLIYKTERIIVLAS